MTYLDYEGFKTKYYNVQQMFADILLEKEAIFNKALPSGIRYDKEQVQTSVDGSPLDEYVIELERIETKITKVRESLKDWEFLLSLKEKELRQSNDLHDRIYVMRILDGYGIKRISKVLNYSNSQVYRICQQISKKCDKMRQ